MKVFLSWSEARSKAVAVALRNWLPLVLHYVEPWLSQQDIAAGERWSIELGAELNQSQYGIICLTPENITAPWILFEAGAISKSFSSSAVCPYLFDLDYSDIPTGPLSQFQGKKADSQSTKELLEAINFKARSPIDSKRLNDLFEMAWPKLEVELNAIPLPSTKITETRSQSEVLEDLVQSIRTIEARFRVLETILPVLKQEAGLLASPGDTIPKIKVIVTADENIGNLVKGQKIETWGSIIRLIEGIAVEAGLDAQKYYLEWHFREKNSSVGLDRADVLALAARYKNKVCLLELCTGIPF